MCSRRFSLSPATLNFKPLNAPQRAVANTEAILIKAADMMIARRADTRARADFATWSMMAKLNGASSLPPAAQAFLDRYKALRQQKSEAEANEAMIQLIYESYYQEMGGAGTAPEVKPQQ